MSLIYIGGLALFVSLGVLGALLHQVMGMRIQRPRLSLRPCSLLPGYLEKLFAPIAAQLAGMGYEQSHCLQAREMAAGEGSEKWTTVFANPADRSYAAVSASSHRAEMPGCEVVFSTLYSDGSFLLALNGRKHTVACQIPHTEIIDPYAASLSAHRQAFADKAAEMGQRREALAIAADTYVQRHQKALDDYMDVLEAEGWLRATEPAEFGFRLGRALPFVIRILRGEQRLAKALRIRRGQASSDGIDSTEVPVEAEVDAFQRLEALSRRRPMGRFGKIALFATSAILFCLAFGIEFSFATAAILLGVIGFHEMGHLWGMRLFNYKDLQVFFIPFFGAAALGTDKQAQPYQRVIVSLLGPAPGILLGGALLWLNHTYTSALLGEIAWIMLLVNYLNLLPFMPLDGGRVLQQTLLARFPRGQAVFTILSAAGFGWGAWYLSDSIFGIIALALLLGAVSQWRQGWVLGQLQDALAGQPASTDERTRLIGLFGILQKKSLRHREFLNKVKVIQALERLSSRRSFSWRAAAAGLAAYGLLLVLPLVGLTETLQWMAPFSGSASSAMLEHTPDWQEALARAADADERWAVCIRAGDWYYDIEEDTQAADFFKLASEAAESFPDTDIRRATSLVRLARTSPSPAAQRDLLTRALEIQKWGLGLNHPDLAQTLEEIAWTYGYQGAENAAAISCLKQVVEIQTKAQGPNHPELSASLTALGTRLAASERRDEAEACFLQALDITRNCATVPGDPRLLEAMDILARHYAGTGRTDLAATYLGQKLSLQAKAAQDPMDALGISRTEAQLGWITLADGRLRQAAVYFQQALEHNMQGFSHFLPDPDLNLSLVPVLLDLAHIRIRQGQSAAARPLFDQALLILDKTGLQSAVDYRAVLVKNLTQPSGWAEDPWSHRRWAAHILAIDALTGREVL